MTYEEAMQMILPGRYRHFKGNEYEVIGIARHSEDYEADERGELPPDLKRGVLSQDALYDLLEERKL